MKNIKSILGVFVFMALMVSGMVSCDKKQAAPNTEKYVEAIKKEANSYNAKCPIKNDKNGTTITSVSYQDSALVFVCETSDKNIVTVNLDSARTAIIGGMSDNLKDVLVKGKCDVVYKYKSQNDSSTITIVPQEIEATMPKKQVEAK